MSTRPNKSTRISKTPCLRGAVRVPVRATVTAANSNRQVVGRIANLSVTGIYVESDKHFADGDAVLVELCISELDAVYDIAVGGTVVRNDGKGMGIHFNRLSGPSRSQIEDLVERLQ